METFNLELYPHRQAHIALFQNVQNASELLQRISAQDKDLTCTLLKPTYVKTTYFYACQNVRN